ncbi:29902_t:CDS:10, partial [Racocetra persica]
DIYAWPMFNEMAWYTTLEKVKNKLDKRESTYDNANYFVDYIKTMLAKLMVGDWNPLDEAIVYRRVSTLKRLLNTAINMGIEQLEPFIHELKDRSTGSKIPDDIFKVHEDNNESLQNNSKFVLSEDLKNKINSSPLPKDSQLLLYKNEDSDLVDISGDLIKFFKEHIMKRENTAKDETWFNNLCIFLDCIVKRRVNRVKLWYKQNTKNFSQDNSHIIQGNNLLLQEISKDHKQKDHNSDHDCLTDHKCHFICQFDDLHSDQNPKGVCKHEGGHDGKHICDKIRHECGKPCYLSDKKNCNKYCTNEVDHSEETKHMCNSVHLCGEECSLKINTERTQYKCPNYCVLPYDKEHKENEHCCESESCPMPCPMPKCMNKCNSNNHHHALEGAGIKHLCGESPGICHTQIIEKNAVYKGKRSDSSDINFTKYVQTKKRLQCYKKIPADKTFHDGSHIHEENAMHTCECTRHYGHTGLHYTTHGNMNSTIFIADTDNFEYKGYKLMTGDSGVFEFCNMHCKNSRRHRHIDYCKYKDKPNIQLKGHTSLRSREFRNHFEDKEDGVRHINDPYTALEQEDFEKCDHECTDEIHQKSIDGLSPEKSYCDLQLFHDPINALPSRKKGYLSNDGH